MTPMIAPTQHIALLAILFLSGYVGIRLQRLKMFKYLSPVVITLTFTAILANTKVIPNEAFVYDLVWDFFIPLSVPLVLLRADFKHIYEHSGPTLTAFIFGALGTILGAVVVFTIFDLHGELGKLVTMFCATYIGGSVNFVAVSQALALENKSLFFAGGAADNITMAMYFTALGVMSTSAYMLKKFPVPPSAVNVNSTQEVRRPLDVHTILLAIAVATALVGLAEFTSKLVTELTGTRIAPLLFITGYSLIFTNVFKGIVKTLGESEVLGYALLQIFFGVIGASADVTIAVTQAPQIFVMTVIMLSMHLLVLFTLGRIFGIDLRSLIIASNANVGGPATAAAMATNFGWQEHVVPGILTGILGYSVANYIALGLASMYGVI